MMQAIETPSTGGRVPDMLVRSYNTTWFVELKVLRTLGSIPWRRGQISWAEQYIRLGGYYMLIIGFGQILYVFKYHRGEDLFNRVKMPLSFTYYKSMRNEATVSDTIHGLPTSLFTSMDPA